MTQFLKFTAACLVVFVAAHSYFAQPGNDIRGAAFGSGGKASNKTAKVSKQKSGAASQDKPEPRPRAAAAPASRNNRVRGRRTAAAAPAKFVTVKFTSREPLVEVWLNNRYYGLTDSKLEFNHRLALGTYDLMAKSKQRVMLPAQKITITEDKTAFKLYSEVLPEVKRASQDLSRKDEKTLTDDEKQTLLTEKVNQIIADYKDPMKTDALTAEDWQIVYQSAELRQLKGYNAVQIEAYRWFASGMLEMFNERYKNAFTAFDESKKYWKDSPYPDYEIANAYLANKQPEAAVRIYQKVLQIDPKLAVAHKKLGDSYRLLNRDKEAAIAYKAALDYGYKTPETSYWLGTLMLKNSKQIEEGIKILEDVVKEMPRSEVFVSIAEGYEKLKRSLMATQYYQKATEADKDNALAHYRLANIYFEEREYENAKINFDKAIALDPEGKKINLKEAQKKSREAASKMKK